MIEEFCQFELVDLYVPTMYIFPVFVSSFIPATSRQ